ncbi:putative quinol monooxygenase [Aquabacterium sp. NJ1]|uniref:putative quinol monooxygenase n=1 Tax=Aquabacterium sp. NJ1 TaxID=1538295 RepID=UPI00068FEAE5|nr:putative quinol monooxygenase [Aquabacterium sp. NJ1]
MFVLFVELTPKPAYKEQLESLLRSMTKVAAQEEGILFYSVHRPSERPDTFLLYECYKDEAAWETHMQVSEIQAAIEQFGNLLEKAPGITRCTSICTTQLRQEHSPSASKK